MKYQLTEKDYLEIYPLLYPEQIRKRFEGRCVSSRTIQRIYKKYNLPSIQIAQKILYERAYAIADTNTNEKDCINSFFGVIAENIGERIDRINKRIKTYEGLFK